MARGGRVLIASVVAAALVVPAPAASVAGGGQPDRPPNILLIVTDDQRAGGTLGVMPHTRRWFRKEGVTFTNAFVTTPTCAPSRASSMTGQYAHNHGVRFNHGAPQALDQDTTLQRYLRDAGYRTALVGKFLNGWGLEPEPRHFDRWALRKGAYHDVTYNVDGDIQVIPGYTTRVLADLAAGFVEDLGADPSTPWLLMVTPNAPHGPWIPEDVYSRAPVPPWHGNPAVRSTDRRGKPGFVRRRGTATLQDGRTVRRKQLRMLMSVDDLVDRVFSAIDQIGALDDTLAIFTSDNGMAWADHGLIGKGVPYTPSVRVPLLLRWPERFQGGQRRPDLAANIDLAPTILEAAGVVPGHVMDGRSLLRPTERRRLLLEWVGSRGGWASFRSRRVQYMEYYRDGGPRVRFREFYRLGPDPHQLANVLEVGPRSRRPDVRRQRQILAALRRCVGTEGPSACP